MIEKDVLVALRHKAKDDPDAVRAMVGTVTSYLDDDRDDIRWNATAILETVAEPHPGAVRSAIEPIRNRLSDDDERVRAAAVATLAHIAKASPEDETLATEATVTAVVGAMEAEYSDNTKQYQVVNQGATVLHTIAASQGETLAAHTDILERWRYKAQAQSIDSAELRCSAPACEFTTKANASSLRVADFCPECHEGTLARIDPEEVQPKPTLDAETLTALLCAIDTTGGDTRLPTQETAQQRSDDAKTADITLSDEADITLVRQLLRSAMADDEELRYQGIRGLSRLFQQNSISRNELLEALDSHQFDAERALSEALIEMVTENLDTSIREDTRGRAALALGYVAAARPAAIPIDEVLDDLLELLRHGNQPVRRRRAIFALRKVAGYDAPDRATVRARMAEGKSLAAIRELATDRENQKTQSAALCALGYVALSHPEAVAPGETITAAVTDDTLRPRTRNRAVRALWQLGLSRPEIVRQHLDVLVDLLSYDVAQAQETNYLDGDDLEAHAKYLRSNAAKAIGIVAIESPTAVDTQAITRLVEILRTDAYRQYRPLLALGELTAVYAERIRDEEGDIAVQTVLAPYEGTESDDLSERERTTAGYASWTLVRLSDQCSIDWEPTDITVNWLFAVPDTEKTQFHRRRVEALATLAVNKPTLVATDDVESYLAARAEASQDSTESDLITTVQRRLRTYRTGLSTEHYIPDIPPLRRVETRARVPVIEKHNYSSRHGSTIFTVTLKLDGEPTPAWLKVVRPHNEVEALTNFEYTTAAWNKIDGHENIVTILAWGMAERPWVANELLGESLGDVINGGPFEINHALWIGERLADALQHAHNKGVIHFDLQPDNVVFEEPPDEQWNRPKITDWQFAKRVDDVSGSLRDYTQEYAAPEIKDSDWGPVNQKADLYHLGEILYEMLTGDQWERGQKPPESYRPDVPNAVGKLVMDLLNGRPGNRPDTAAQVRNRLRELRSGGGRYIPPSETTTPVATIEPPLSEVGHLRDVRDDSINDCLRQATEIRRKVNLHSDELSGDAYDELCAQLDDLIEELSERPNPERALREGTDPYNRIDDIHETAQSVYQDYIHLDSIYHG